MNVTNEMNQYGRYLQASGFKVWNVDGVDWFEYNGFLRPAYLPHATPVIGCANARRAVAVSRRPFARWDDGFQAINETSGWWYIVRFGPYDISQCSSNTRSKINRGAKRLSTRIVCTEEVREKGWQLFHRASARYGTEQFVPCRETFEKKLNAANQHPESVEYFGVLADNELVGLSENHIQHGGCFWENIWYDPEYLGDYSSYLLTHRMLEHYLGSAEISYVSDGCRSLYHDTNVQDFFQQKFGFTVAYSKLQLEYSRSFGAAFWFVWRLRSIIRYLTSRSKQNLLKKMAGLIQQHQIALECRNSRKLSSSITNL